MKINNGVLVERVFTVVVRQLAACAGCVCAVGVLCCSWEACRTHHMLSAARRHRLFRQPLRLVSFVLGRSSHSHILEGTFERRCSGMWRACISVWWRGTRYAFFRSAWPVAPWWSGAWGRWVFWRESFCSACRWRSTAERLSYCKRCFTRNVGHVRAWKRQGELLYHKNGVRLIQFSSSSEVLLRWSPSRIVGKWRTTAMTESWAWSTVRTWIFALISSRKPSRIIICWKRESSWIPDLYIIYSRLPLTR